MSRVITCKEDMPKPIDEVIYLEDGDVISGDFSINVNHPIKLTGSVSISNRGGFKYTGPQFISNDANPQSNVATLINNQ